MDIQAWSVVLSLFCLLGGTFLLGNIRGGILGALAAVLILKWQGGMVGEQMTIDVGNGLVISFELLLLLFGALFFYEVLSVNGHFHFIEELIEVVPSRVSIVVILCLFLCSFFEGIAGFGIPSMLIAPLMHRAGFKNLSSIVLPLAANTTAVTFGALGTPLKIGLGILEPNSAVFYVAMLNVLPAFCLPFALAFLYGKTEKVEIDWKQEARTLLGAGISFAGPYFLVSFWSVEFPSVVAGGVGLIFFMLLFVKTKKELSLAFWWAAFYPYLIFILLLLLFKQLLVGHQVAFHAALRPLNLFQPGWVFLLAIGFYLLILIRRKRPFAFKKPFNETLVRLKDPLITILLLVCYCQLVGKDLASQVSGILEQMPKDLSVMSLPFVGIFGSFITGSATMSNLLLRDTALSLISNSAIALALLHTGGALGNVISLQNIVMVKSVLHSTLKEGKVIKNTGWIALGYSFLVIVVLQVLVWAVGK